MVISKDDFKALPPDDRDYIIYTTVNNVERRVYALEQKRWINRGASFLGGIAGGIIAILGVKWRGLY